VILYVVSTRTVGNVPRATRVDEEKEIPAGSPVTLYEYGGLPPVAAGNSVLTTPRDGARKFGMSGSDNGIATHRVCATFGCVPCRQ